MSRQQRIDPTEADIKKANELLAEVPYLGRDWSSDSGKEFAAFCSDLAKKGVAMAWLADRLGIAPSALYSLIGRYRAGVR